MRPRDNTAEEHRDEGVDLDRYLNRSDVLYKFESNTVLVVDADAVPIELLETLLTPDYDGKCVALLTDEAIEWYLTAYDYSYGTDALEEYAYALKRTQQYAEAIQAFKDLGNEIGSPYEYKREIRNCEIAMKWLTVGAYEEYTVGKTRFNNRAADFSPAIYLGNALVFSSDRAESMGEEEYSWTGKDFMDLFIVDLNTNEVTSFESPINTVHNEGSAVFTKDFGEMYFIRCFGDEDNQAFCKIMRSEKDGNSWTVPQVVDFTEPAVNYISPALSDDGNTLYFSANHPDDGWGGFDIYESKRTPAGWDIPKILSRNVNTIGHEKFPTVDADTLYFSSDFHAGMGGLDIFRVYKRDNGEWSSPFNLKAPINSGADDFNYVVDYRAPIVNPKVIHKGYFTSTRDEGSGLDDIYTFEKLVPPPPPPKDTTKEEPPVVYSILLPNLLLNLLLNLLVDLLLNLLLDLLLNLLLNLLFCFTIFCAFSCCYFEKETYIF